MIQSAQLDALKSQLLKIHHLKSAAALLSWDQETYMPSGGGQARADQIATLQTLAHNALVSPEIESLLATWLDPATGRIHCAEHELDEPTTAMLRETWRDFSRAKKLPSDFVHRLERECSLAQQVWGDARAKNDFAQFTPNLRIIVSLKQEEAEYLGYQESPYNALLDTYEPEATVRALRPLFTSLRDGLVKLLDRIRNAPNRPQESLLHQTYDRERQLQFGRKVLTAMGYDFTRGRMDLSAHPFTTAFHPTDVRVTTRVFEQDLLSCLFSCIHEGGHGLYEQGLPSAMYGTPLGEAVSLGIHESQSRFWENCIGRSKPFWSHFFPILQQTFPEQLKRVTVEEFYRMINAVKPSLIRVEADEVTYNLHIMLRFEIELDLIERRAKIEDLPELWRVKMQDYLAIVPERDADGVLQDVHWSFGAFGYFPTYTLGNLYATMLFDQVVREIPDLESQIAAGEFIPLKTWLNNKIHRWGRQFTPAALIERITGQQVSADPFLRYLDRKMREVYHC